MRLKRMGGPGYSGACVRVSTGTDGGGGDGVSQQGGADGGPGFKNKEVAANPKLQTLPRPTTQEGP